MPGLYSPQRLAARRARALQRGYLVLHPVSKRTLSAYDAGNGVALPAGVDPLQSSDPWKYAKQPPNPESSRCHDAPWDTWRPYFSFNAGAPVFLPSASPPSSGVTSAESMGSIEQALCLIRAQNDTIALLRGQLEAYEQRASTSAVCLDNTDDDSVVTKRLRKIEADIESLASSLGHAVQISVERRSLPLEQRFSSSVENATLQIDRIHERTLSLEQRLLEQSTNCGEQPSGTCSSFDQKVACIQASTNEKIAETVSTLTEYFNQQIQNSLSAFMDEFLPLLAKLKADCDRKFMSLESRIASKDAIQQPGESIGYAPIGNKDYFKQSDDDIGNLCGDRARPHEHITVSGDSCEGLSEETSDDVARRFLRMLYRGISSRLRDMTCSEFVKVAADVRARLPHIIETSPAPLMICDIGPSHFEKLGRRIAALRLLQSLQSAAVDLLNQMMRLRDDLAFGDLPNDEDRVNKLCHQADAFIPKCNSVSGVFHN